MQINLIIKHVEVKLYMNKKNKHNINNGSKILTLLSTVSTGGGEEASINKAMLMWRFWKREWGERVFLRDDLKWEGG